MTRLKKLRFALAPFALIACAQVAVAATLDVAKTPTCGCCGVWVERMRAAGFTLKVRNVQDTGPVAKAAGVPDRLRSCHTAKIGGYVIEGHVPAADIRRLLKEKPNAVGLSVPGMVAGSPGMETPGRATPTYQTLLIGRNGKVSVWATHAGSQPK